MGRKHRITSVFFLFFSSFFSALFYHPHQIHIRKLISSLMVSRFTTKMNKAIVFTGSFQQKLYTIHLTPGTWFSALGDGLLSVSCFSSQSGTLSVDVISNGKFSNP